MASVTMVLAMSTLHMGRCYKHITIEECEEILVAQREGKSICAVVREIEHNLSMIKRELDRKPCRRGGRGGIR